MLAERTLLPMGPGIPCFLQVGHSFSCHHIEIHNQSDSSSHSRDEGSPFEGKTGSGSLLSTSESDGWNGRSGLPWPTTVNNTSPILSRTNSHSISPLRQRSGDQRPLQVSDPSGRCVPLSSVNRPSFGQVADQAPQGLQSNPMLTFAPHGSNVNSFPVLNDARPGEEMQQPISKTTTLGSSALVPSASSAKHYSNAVSEPSMHNGTAFPANSSSRTHSDMQSGTYFRPSVFASKSNTAQSTGLRAFHRPFHSTDSSLDNGLQDIDDATGSKDEHLASELERLTSHGTDPLTQRSRSRHRLTMSSQMSYDCSGERSTFGNPSDERFSAGQNPYTPDSLSEHGFQYPPAHLCSTSFDNRGPSSPTMSESRRELNSTFYTTVSTPHMAPNSLRASSGSGLSRRAPNGQVSLLEKKLRGLQPYQSDQQSLQPNPLQMRSSYQQQIDMPYQTHIQMNPLARPYAMPPYSAYSSMQSAVSQNARYTRAEQESSQLIRSPLLEDFRTNSKTNKRYELKVISFLISSIQGLTIRTGHLQSCG